MPWDAEGGCAIEWLVSLMSDANIYWEDSRLADVTSTASVAESDKGIALIEKPLKF